MNRTVQEFRLPDVGEGLTEAVIVTWHVAIGESIAVNQVIVEIETAKSVVDLPASHSGDVLEVLAAEGETVQVGTPILRINSSTGTKQSTGSETEHTAEDEPKLLADAGDSSDREERSQTQTSATQQANLFQETSHGEASPRPRAKPPVRKLAKDLGVDLAAVPPSGAKGIVVRQDVLDHAEAVESSEQRARTAANETNSETRIPIKGIRKHTAAAVVASAFTAPHVTESITVDITRTLQLSPDIQQRREFRNVKLTPLAFVARAYLRAIARTPMANARWEEEPQEIVLPQEVNLGIAAATPRGLVVPNIKGAQRLSLQALAAAINDLAASAREGKTTPEAMAQGTTTITNIGVFGVDSGTPILNPGESAILAVGAVRRIPWVVQDGEGERIEPRSVLQLTLSFDHRVIDGQQGSDLLTDTAAVLTEPGLALLET